MKWDKFAGSSAFSEPETKSIAQFVLPLKPTLAISLHSATGALFYLFFYDDEALPDNVEETVRVPTSSYVSRSLLAPIVTSRARCEMG